MGSEIERERMGKVNKFNQKIELEQRLDAWSKSKSQPKPADPEAKECEAAYSTQVGESAPAAASK